MLRYVTQKLQSQSLSESSPVPQESPDEQPQSDDKVSCPPNETEAGVEESDAENDEICSIIEGNRESDHNQENQPSGLLLQVPVQQRVPLRPVHPNNSQEEPVAEAEGGGEAGDKAAAAAPQVKPVSEGVVEEGCPSGRPAGEPSPCTCGDAPASSLAPGLISEGRSSAEELEMINCCSQVLVAVGGEKRKWAAAVGGGCSSSSGGSSTTDEEVQDLTMLHSLPTNFSCSPPQGLPRFMKKVSPHHFLANVGPGIGSPTPLWISPRKRQRQSSLSSDSDLPTVQRPFLDLEKMQKSFFKRNSPHSTTKAKIVKIKTINNNRSSPKCIPDPAIFSFRSISTNHLTPVEEPCAF